MSWKGRMIDHEGTITLGSQMVKGGKIDREGTIRINSHDREEKTNMETPKVVMSTSGVKIDRSAFKQGSS